MRRIEEVIMIILFLMLMTMASFHDIRTLHIPVWVVIMQGMTAAAQTVIRIVAERGISDELKGMLVLAACLLVVSAAMTMLKRKAVGSGDWIVLILTALMLTVAEFCIEVMTALTAVAVFSAFLMIFKKVGGDHRIPFIPFLTIGMVFGVCIG